MKKQILMLATPVILGGCSTNQPSCVLLKFNHQPPAGIVERLADTQPAGDRLEIRKWFSSGETGFVLSSIHTNEIQSAVESGATATILHRSGGVFHNSIGFAEKM